MTVTSGIWLEDVQQANAGLKFLAFEEARGSEDDYDVPSEREVQEAVRYKWRCFSPILDP